MRRSLLIARILATVTALSFSAIHGNLFGSGGHGVSWNVRLQSAKEVKIVVSTKNVAKNRYIVGALCTVQYLDKNAGNLGRETYNFPVPVGPGEEKAATFSFKYQGVNAVKGPSMKYKLAVLGSRAHGTEATVTEVIEGHVPAGE